MQLKYRGISYQPAFVEDQTADSAQLGLSRRHAAPSEKPAKPNLRKPGDELVYRGVRYTK